MNTNDLQPGELADQLLAECRSSALEVLSESLDEHYNAVARVLARQRFSAGQAVSGALAHPESPQSAIMVRRLRNPLPDAFSAALGERLRSMRRMRGWTLDDATATAKKAGYPLSVPALCRYELGIHDVTVRTLTALSHVYGVDPAELLGQWWRRRTLALAKRRVTAERPVLEHAVRPDGRA